MENEFYKRQVALPEIGLKGQEKLSTARILIIGAGGLGCPVLLYLAGAGIGTIGIVDYDKVEASNLQRQILFTAHDVGQSKAETAKKRICALNPSITVHAHNEELTEKNVVGLFTGYDVIIDGTDNFAAKFLINDASVKLGKPVIYSAIQGFEAQISVFNYMNGPCYRCLHPQPPQAHIMNCAENGVIGAVAGIAGTIQAIEAIKIIVKDTSFKSLSGKLMMIDARTMETNTVTIPKRDDCCTCNQEADNIALQYASPVCSAIQVKEITCAEAANMNAAFIDVRERAEWDAGHIEGAQLLPLSALREKPNLFESHATKRPCIIYCQRGARSLIATEILLKAGFTDLYSMSGGYDAWRSSGI